MTDEQLVKLPSLDAKYAAFRQAVQWGIEQGFVHMPRRSQSDELAARLRVVRKRELMAKAQEVRLAEVRKAKPILGLSASKYYRTADHVGGSE